VKRKTLHVDDPLAVGQRLREARERAGLSQRELAGDACTSAYVSRLELGQRVPSIQLLRLLGSRLGVDADFLATGLAADGDGSSTLLDAEIALRLDDAETARHLYAKTLSDNHSPGPMRSEALAGLGRLALREGEHAEAIKLLSEAVEASGLEAVELPALAETLARAYGAAGELSPAIALLKRCVETYEHSADVLVYIRFASMLGYALTDAGDFAAAEQVVAHALARGQGVVDPYARARLYWSQSRLLAEQGKPAAAEQYARKTLETLQVTEDAYGIARALETLAHICLELGRAREALDLLDEGESLMQGTGSPPDIAHYQLERARALAALGAHEEAASLAMRLAGELGDIQPLARGRAYLLLGDLFLALGDLTRAQELYELAISCLEDCPLNKHLMTAYRALADLMKNTGRRDVALELLERAVASQADHPQQPVSPPLGGRNKQEAKVDPLIPG
jgi:tetratricopeptide (TPR) repeat protein